MSPIIICLIGFVAFFLLVFLRMPIAFAFIVTGLGGLIFFKGFDIGLPVLGILPYATAANYTMVCLPLFILMGQFASHSGISRDLYESAYKIVGRLPGGLALATNLACTGFAACTGSSLASAATMATIALPEMKRLEYDMKLATGCIAAGGTLGILIPPSTMFIIYGYLTEQSIGKLFIAGILPGIMLSMLFLGWILMTSLRNPNLAPRGKLYPWKEALISLKGVWGMIALFILIIGGLYFGIFTPSEAGAMGAFGAFVLALARRRLTWKNFAASLKDSVQITCFVLTILIGATLFNAFLVHAEFQVMLSDWVLDLNVSRYVILALILALYVPMGMFMDTLAMLLLTVPIFFPVLMNLGFDPIWFGVLIVIMVEAALISPPLGVNVFVISTIAPDVPMQNIFWGAIPFFILMLVAVVIIVAFPEIALFLPNIMS